MNQAVTPQKASRLTQLKNRLLKVIMPTHVRRGFFILSLASYVLKQARPDTILAHQLVNQLDLPCKPRVLYLAMDNNQSIWSGLQSAFDCLENHDDRAVGSFVDEVIRSMPGWMPYSNTRLMRQDAIRTLRAARTYAQAA